MIFRLISTVAILLVFGSLCINHHKQNPEDRFSMDEFTMGTALIHHLTSRVADRDYPYSDSTFWIDMVIVYNQRKRLIILEEEMQINSLKVKNALKEKEISNLKFYILDEEIRIKEREQMADALALEQKNELLAMIYNKFSDAIHTTGSMSISDLNGLVSTVKLQISENNQVDVFNQKFGLLHSDFYDKLKNVHPELTKSERKFCAYLRLNLSGSQIAKLANVTT